MSSNEKLKLLLILLLTFFKSKGEKEVKRLLIDSIKKDLQPKDKLPLVVTAVYLDNPHKITEHDTWGDVMTRIEILKEHAVKKEFVISAIHVTQGGDIQYTWTSSAGAIN